MSEEPTESVVNEKYQESGVCCDPCLTASNYFVQRFGFCIDCQENMCKACLEAHRKTKASKHHHIVDAKPTSDGLVVLGENTFVFEEPCEVHRNQVINLFCPYHGTLICNECYLGDHKNCQVQHILDKCIGVEQSEEFRKTSMDVNQAIKEVEDIGKKARLVQIENKTSLKQAVKEIELFQKRIFEKLEFLKRQMIKEASQYKLSQDKHVEEIIYQTNEISSQLRIYQSIMQELQTKHFNEKAFVIMKQAQQSLKSLNISLFVHEIDQLKTKYEFEPNANLENIISLSDGLGELHVCTGQKIYHKEAVFQSLGFDKAITVKTENDHVTCNITGCAALSHNKLILAAWENKKLKIVNIEKQTVEEEKPLGKEPFDIAVLPAEKVAVTLPWAKQILILGTVPRLSTSRIIKVDRQCWGIRYIPNNLFVVCQNPNSILVLDVQGNVQRTIILQKAMNETFSNPAYIAVSKNLQHLYISDWCSNIIVSLTQQGQITAAYSSSELRGPRGLVVIQDGSLLVCCSGVGVIHRVSADLSQGQNVTENISVAKSICLQHRNNTIFVGSQACNDVKLFKMQLW